MSSRVHDRKPGREGVGVLRPGVIVGVRAG